MSRDGQACTSPWKEPFEDRAAAKRAAQAIVQRGKARAPGRMEAYQCPAGHWHITGSARGRSAKRIREIR